ncbi:MAG: SPOR domain-containing protein [Holosporaceae bacterium]|jgi:cell division protein FtsN|nr:SPOR domain-containing protein [Holosporaceae bacterium]
MCPFLDDEDDYPIDIPKTSETKRNFRSNFFKNDRSFFIIGGGASVVAFCIVAFIIYYNSRPIDLEELPIISADSTPFKIKPPASEQVKHQDKTVYDNISGDKRKVEEKIAQPPEEILSIPEVEVGESLSDEEKQNIIKAFDDLAPQKEYKINYVKQGVSKIKSDNLVVVENEYRPPINKIEEKNKVEEIKPSLVAKKQKQRLKDVVEKTSNTADVESGNRSSELMVQIASVTTKSAAEAEYRRILLKNKFLKGWGKKIFKIDLGESKGIRYRIQVGPFKTREEANKVVSLMGKSGFSAYISK